MEINLNELDIEQLRNDLTDYFGTALINEYAMVDLINVQTCSDYELAMIAIANNFDLNNYKIKRLRAFLFCMKFTS